MGIKIIRKSLGMRKMPEPMDAHINPNDGIAYAKKKKQYLGVNQHYLSHHAVLPPYDLAKAMEEMKAKHEGRDSPLAAAMAANQGPYGDPNDKVSTKPNQISHED